MKIRHTDGNEYDVVDVPIVTMNEPWAEVMLADGTTIRLRTVVSAIRRVEGLVAMDGVTPVYNVEAQTLLSVVA